MRGQMGRSGLHPGRPADTTMAAELSTSSYLSVVERMERREGNLRRVFIGERDPGEEKKRDMTFTCVVSCYIFFYCTYVP